MLLAEVRRGRLLPCLAQIKLDQMFMSQSIVHVVHVSAEYVRTSDSQLDLV